jgi:uncharacterized protein YbcC (UPF0753/DUF2309 family)
VQRPPRFAARIDLEPFGLSVMKASRATPSPAVRGRRSAADSGSRLERLSRTINAVTGVVPPVWPLQDYVAVNPFLGLADQRFLDARQLLRDVRACEMLLPAAEFQEQFDRGEITAADVEQAVIQCRQEYPELSGRIEARQLVGMLALAAAAPVGPEERRYHTVSEAIDGRQGSSWSSHLVTDISRHCAAHYDQGQAAWPNPWKHLPLYEAWRESARTSRRMDMLGITGFRRFVAELPAAPEEAVAVLLERLAIPERHWRRFLLCELLSVAGWASFLQYRRRVAAAVDEGAYDEHLVGLLAIRLAYDAALAEIHPDAVTVPGSLFPVDEAGQADAEDVAAPPPSDDGLARYAFQVAAEIAYRRRLVRVLTGRGDAPAADRGVERRTLQMVFCIDVRSEVFRRHLEAVSPAVETFGFAGFFGMPLEFVPLGAAHGPAQCPVLLQPSFRIHERLRAEPDDIQARAVGRRRMVRLGRKVWKSFQTSATSCFTFVESLGLAYLPKLLTDSFGWTRPVLPAGADGVAAAALAALGPDIHAPGADSLSAERRIDLAAGMLRNLGLTSGFARIVAICGHAAEVVNNPYRAGLDCGACGGHSGEPNARVAAALLNDPQVRVGLAGKGIAIPDDTFFVPAVHVTTTDEIRFLDVAGLPAGHAAEFAQVREWVREAGMATRLERSLRMGAEPPVRPGSVAAAETAADIFRRSRDWSEVRPEWGLAGNAAFIIAPRSRTAGLDLGGRTFLHSYEPAKDPDLKVLELILTAPMVVTSWINLQYYASAVDNLAFGSGNKAIHNVTGQLGVLLGNGGDLMTGLPWQSVSDGVRLQHEPLRLTVLVEAPRSAVETILDRHAGVRALATNGWLTLVVREGDTFHRL